MAIGFVSFILESSYFPLPAICTYCKEQLCSKQKGIGFKHSFFIA